MPPFTLTSDQKRSLLADFSLLLVALFWGSNFVITKGALDAITPFAYLGIRFILASLILAVVFWPKMLRLTRRDLLCGSVVGAFLFSGFALQTIGLLYTTPAKSGFITGISVVIVPFMCYAVKRVSPGWWSFAGGFLAAGGLFLLSANDRWGLEFGDGLTLAAAFLFAAHIISIDAYAPRTDPVVLAFGQIAFTGLASAAAALLFEPRAALVAYPPAIWAAIFYAAVFCTIGAFITQSAAQRHTPATHAALILCLEAVFAGLFAYFFWQEQFTLVKLAGAGLIFAGILTTETVPLWRQKSLSKEPSL